MAFVLVAYDCADGPFTTTSLLKVVLLLEEFSSPLAVKQS